MRQSHLFTKTRKEIPADETSKNAQLLLKAGYVHKEMAGVYDLLPLGMKVVEKIKEIVRQEMNAIGGTEFIMSSLQTKDVWTRTGRWSEDVVDVWFKSELNAGGEIGFGWSHEEPIVEMMKNHLSSYKDLPINVYQFQNKFRNELRAKSGLMRGREFVMKDMYSFSQDAKQHEAFYQKTIEAYHRCYERFGIGKDTFITFAAGGAFTEFSHEFQTICETGEDEIYINRDKRIAINHEVYNEKTLLELGVSENELEKVTTAEVGNIFNFGTQKCEEMGLYFNDDQGKQTPAHLGSYGIGITRVMGVIAEKFSDAKGLVWPLSIAPYRVHVLLLGDDEKIKTEAETLYTQLTNAGIEVLFDDRTGMSAGEKFADSDLIGIPYRVVISSRSMASGGIEVKERTEEKGRMLTVADFLQEFSKRA
ncbi:MAG: prolyl-tRNA synthetase [Candidatus Pacebacteria bacterium]|nr:prolyl-tRNA synthetase [Candidatus Paceibacterota bacterium]